MSTSFVAKFSCTILAGQTNSVVVSNSTYHDASALLIHAPATLPESVKIQVNPDPDAQNASAGWCDLTDYSGAVINAPALSQARWYPELPAAAAFRLVASVGVAADRVFSITKTFTI